MSNSSNNNNNNLMWKIVTKAIMYIKYYIFQPLSLSLLWINMRVVTVMAQVQRRQQCPAAQAPPVGHRGSPILSSPPASDQTRPALL